MSQIHQSFIDLLKRKRNWFSQLISSQIRQLKIYSWDLENLSFFLNILKICFESPSFARASGNSVKKLFFWDFSVWLGVVYSSCLKEIAAIHVFVYIHLNIFTYILIYTSNIRIQEHSIRSLVIKAVGLLFKKTKNEFASLLQEKKNSSAGHQYTLLMHKAKICSLLSGMFLSLST